MKTLEQAFDTFNVRSEEERVNLMSSRNALVIEVDDCDQAHDVAQVYLSLLMQTTGKIADSDSSDAEPAEEVKVAVWRILLCALTHGILVGMEMEKQELTQST